jgi:hypothetical protein
MMLSISTPVSGHHGLSADPAASQLLREALVKAGVAGTLVDSLCEVAAFAALPGVSRKVGGNIKDCYRVSDLAPLAALQLITLDMS